MYRPVVVRSSGGTAVGPEQIDPDLADALFGLEVVLYAWWRHINMATLDGLDAVLADPDQAARLATAVLDPGVPDADGDKRWSVVDAMKKWGVERRDTDRYVYQDDADVVQEIITPIHESRFDPLLVSKDAAAVAGVTERQLRRWVSAGELDHAARLRDGAGVWTRWYRQSEVAATAERMRARRHAGKTAALE